MFTRATNIMQDQGVYLLYLCSDCNLAREAVVSLNCMHYSAHLASFLFIVPFDFTNTLPHFSPFSVLVATKKFTRGSQLHGKKRPCMTQLFAILLRWLRLHSFLSSCDHDGCFGHLSAPLDQSDVRIRARCVTLPTAPSGRFREACKLTSRLSEVKVMANSQCSHYTPCTPAIKSET